jgi:hypothetical protein
MDRNTSISHLLLESSVLLCDLIILNISILPAIKDLSIRQVKRVLRTAIKIKGDIVNVCEVDELLPVQRQGDGQFSENLSDEVVQIPLVAIGP